MSLERESSEELIVIYCHRFDAVSGFYAQSTPVGVCAENDLPDALQAVNADISHVNYLLEAVAFTELAPEDQLEAVNQFWYPDIFVRWALPNACTLGGELQAYG